MEFYQKKVGIGSYNSNPNPKPKISLFLLSGINQNLLLLSINEYNKLSYKFKNIIFSIKKIIFSFGKMDDNWLLLKIKNDNFTIKNYLLS